MCLTSIHILFPTKYLEIINLPVFSLKSLFIKFLLVLNITAICAVILFEYQFDYLLQIDGEFRYNFLLEDRLFDFISTKDFIEKHLCLLQVRS